MKLTEVLENDKNSFNSFVAASPSGSFLQSWDWGSWQESLGRKVLRFKILNADDAQIGSVQLIKMPLPFGKYYLYAPYGPVVGDGKWDIGDWKAFVEEVKRVFSDVVFVRIEPKMEFAIRNPQFSILKTANIQPGKTLLIDLGKSEEEILAGMHPKTRYNIKVAQKHGVEIKDEFAISVGHGLFFDEAIKLLAQTAKRQKFTTFEPKYYKKMADMFAMQKQGDLQLHIYKAIYQNQLLAAAFMVDFGGTRTFLFGGSSEVSKNVMAPYLLHWQAMQDAKAAGFGSYDFWGVETSSGEIPGFVRFKLGFGGETKTYAGAYDIVNKSLPYKLYRAGRFANKLKKKISS